MRILWLKSDLLLPLDKGGKLRTWHLMRQLAKHHAITFLSYADPEQPAEDIEGMREVASEVVTVARHDPAKGTLAFYLDAAQHLVDSRPYAVSKYESAAYRKALREAMERTAFDLIVCDFLRP